MFPGVAEHAARCVLGLVDRLVGWVGRSVGWLFGWLTGSLDACFFSWLVWVIWLVGWLLVV